MIVNQISYFLCSILFVMVNFTHSLRKSKHDHDASFYHIKFTYIPSTKFVNYVFNGYLLM